MNDPDTADRAQSTRLLERVCGGVSDAASELLPLVYSQLRGLASRYLRADRAGHTLQPTALVHEAYVRLVDSEALSLNGEAHFAAVCAKAMREVLLDHARGKNAQKRGGGWQRVTLSGPIADGSDEGIEFTELIALDEALAQLADLDPEQARLVELRFFGGMTIRDIGQVLGVSHTTVQRELRTAQAWLQRAMEGKG